MDGYRHAIRLWTFVLEIVRSRWLTSPRRRPPEGPSTTALRRPRLRQPRLAVDAKGGPLRLGSGQGHDRRTHRGAHRRFVLGFSGDGRSLRGHSPVCREPRVDDACDAQSPARRVRCRPRRVRGRHPHRGGHRCCDLSSRDARGRPRSRGTTRWRWASGMATATQASVLAPTGCLVGGSLIATERGLVRLRSLGDTQGSQWQDLGIDVSTDEGPRTATQFYVNGVEPVVTVKTTRGYRIEGTPTHRIKVVQTDGSWVWKRLADVTADDLVPLALDQLIGEPQSVTLPPKPEVHWTGDFTSTVPVPAVMTNELAEFLGYFMGDGSLHAKGIRLCVAADDFDVAERLPRPREVIVLPRGPRDHQGRLQRSLPSTQCRWCCGGRRAVLRRCRTRVTPVRDTAPTSPMPSSTATTSAVYSAFLRGSYEADGTASGGYPSWSTTDLEFSHDVQALLLAWDSPRPARPTEPDGASPTLGAPDPQPLQQPRLAGSDRVHRCPQAGRGDGDRASAGGSVRPYPRHYELVDRLAPLNDNLRKTMLLALSRHGMVSRRSAVELHRRNGDPELKHLLSFFYDSVSSAALGEEQWTYDLAVPGRT